MSEIKTINGRNIHFTFDNGYTVSIIPAFPNNIFPQGGFDEGSNLQEIMIWDKNGDAMKFGDGNEITICTPDETARLIFETSQIKVD
jgi:hypothetical protein